MPAFLFRPFIAPLLSFVLLVMASGLFNTFIPIRLEIEGYTPEATGFIVSALYAGMLIGSLRIDRWIGKTGHVKAFVILATSSCALVLAQGLLINAWYWVILRFLGGICMAGIFIAIESWLLIQSAASNRGAMLSVYLGVFYGALTLGQFLINLSDPAGPFPFYITAFFCVLSTIPLTVKKPAEPKIEEMAPLNMIQLFCISPLGFIGVVISGMLLAVVFGLAPVYGKEIGLSISEIGNLMAMIIFGGLSLQWPLGRWADKGNRRKILYTASFLSSLFCLLIPLIDQNSVTLLLLLAWGFGGFSFTIYPLSMAYSCERVQEGQIVAATGGFVLSYGIGAVAGPLLAPLAMNQFGPHGLFYFLAAISFFLGFIGLKRPKIEVSHFEE